MTSRQLCTVALACLVVTLAGAPVAVSAELSEMPGNLDGDWLFSTDPNEVGEKEGWQAAEFDDSGWRTLRVPGGWEEQGITDPRPGQPPRPKDGMPWSDYDGVAWYRLHFTAREGWVGQDLELLLGSIDDQDRTFLNGKLVGEVGPGVNQAVSIWRRYKVPEGLLRLGEENVLAIRVLDGGGPGGIMGPAVSLLPVGVLSEMSKLPGLDRPFAERFQTPPAQARILPIIHPWPDNPDAQDSKILTLISQGFGGVVCNVSFDQYTESQEHWEQLLRAVTEAKKAGMALWLYDERGYPSGVAGGLTMDGRLLPQWRQEGIPPAPSVHPEWEAQGRFIADARTTGGEVSLEVPPGNVILVAAYPVEDGQLRLDGAVELSSLLKDGKLKWNAPAGEWHVMAVTEGRLYEGTHAAVSLCDKLPYINLLMPEPTKRFLEVTHDRYAEHLGDDLGKTFVATFTDEPSLMSMFMRAMPYRVLPWAPNLPAEFEKRRGRALEPLLPAIVADTGSEGQRARHDFWLTVGELVSENFFGQIQEWCHAHNLRSGGHPLCEEGLLNHVALYGDFFRCIRRLDAPSIDCLTSAPPSVPWYIGRFMISAAELEGKTVTMCETSDFAQVYRPEGDKREPQIVTEEQIRGTCNRLMLGGINTITSYYSFRNLSGEQLRRINEYVGRCCTTLTGGDLAADIAMLYPIESTWAHFTPARSGPTDGAGAHEVQRVFNTATESLYKACRDFCYIDSRTLLEAKADAGALSYEKPGGAGSLAWRVLVLPRADTLPLAAWEQVASFWRSGGIVIAMGALPRNSESEFPSSKVQALAREMFGEPTGAAVHANDSGGAGVYLPAGAEALLPTVLDGLLGRDVTVDRGAPIRATHRRVEGHDVYFLINDSPDAWKGDVSVSAAGSGELWDPLTGKSTPLPGADEIHLDLPAYAGALLRFTEAAPPARLAPQEGGLPGLTTRALPTVTPGVGKGEFVQGGSEVDEALSTPDAPAWRMTGTLTKSNVDTFLFATFQYPDGINMSDADCLVLDSWVPEGQTTPTDLLVILTDADGGQYLASTGRRMGATGRQEAFLPISAFELAGWAKDPNGRMDLACITAMSIGWGGYFGKEGERVQFTLATPKVGVLGERQ